MAGELGMLTQPSWYRGTQPGWHVGTGYVPITNCLLTGAVRNPTTSGTT
jgi:hypothetical protein